MSKEMLDGKRVKNIKIIPYSHHDYAWVCTRSWHKSRYIKCFSDVLDKLRENPDFVWHIDNVIHSLLPFIENCPENAEEFRRYVKEGRIVVLNGGYSLARPSYVGEESYIRNMIAGKKFLKKYFGIDSIPCLFNADTACGHSQIPQIAKLGGHKYYHFLRPNSCLTNKRVPFQFVWRGLDGSELITARGNYGSLWTGNTFLNNDYESDEKWEETKEEYFSSWLSDKVIEGLTAETVVQFIGSDDSLPLCDAADKPLKIGEFMAEWNKREKVKMSYASLNEVFGELSKSGLPVFDGVLDHAELAFNFPSKGSKSLWRMRIVLDRLIVLCEKLCVIAHELGYKYPEKEIERLWLDLFEITGHATEYIQAKNAEELYDIAQKAKFEAIYIINKARDYITANVSRESEIQAVAVNTNMWDIEVPVSLEVTSWHGVAGFEVLDSDGKNLEYQITDCQDGYSLYEGAEHIIVDILVYVKIPALGYTSLIIKETGVSGKPPAEKGFIDLLPAHYPKDCDDEICFNNGRIEAKFFKGSIASLKDLRTGKSLDNPAGGLKFFEYPPESSWITNYSKINASDFIPESWKILKNGPVRWSYEVCGKIAGQKASLIYSMDKNSQGIDIEARTDFVNTAEGMLIFSVKADADAEIYADVPFGTEKREFFDNLPNDAEWGFHGQIYARNWCSFTSASGKAPIALVSQNCSIYYIYERAGEEMQLVLNRSMPLITRTDRWVGKMPDSTNGTGENNYNFSLIFAEKSGKSSDIQKYHKDRAFPPSAQLKFDTGKSGAKACDSLIKADKENIINTAAYYSENKTILRFFECDGQKTECRIALPSGTKSVRAVDFDEAELPEVRLNFDKSKNEAAVEFLPYKIITLELE